MSMIRTTIHFYLDMSPMTSIHSTFPHHDAHGIKYQKYPNDWRLLIPGRSINILMIAMIDEINTYRQSRNGFHD